MPKTRNNNKRRYAGPYDVPMIRDFLDHLAWELRINVHELTHGRTINPELVDQLAKYQRKRRTVGLLDAMSTTSNDARALRGAGRVKLDLRKAQLRCLEGLLASLLPEAIYNAERPDSFNVRKFDSAEAMAGWYRDLARKLHGSHDDGGPDRDAN